MPTIESRARLLVATLTLGMTGAASMASSVAAQDRGKAGTIAGVVRDSAGASVAGADVRIGGTALRTESNADGAFRFTGAPAGQMSLQVRRLGFRPASVLVDVGEGAASKVDVIIASTPAALPPVIVRGTNRQYRGRMAEFYHRRDAGNGRFVTRAEIEKQNPRVLSDVLRRLPGVTLHATNAFRGPRPRMRGARMSCAPQFVIDGTQLAAAAEMDLDQIEPRAVEGIEVYSGPATVPVQFQMANTGGCGMILIWTRSGEPRPRKGPSAAKQLAEMVEALRIYTADQVESPARASDEAPVHPYYPNALLGPRTDSVSRHGGENFAYVEFVVDTTGRVEMDSYSAISMTHPLFADAVREALPIARFHPAVQQGRRVRQVIQQRFDFVRGSGEGRSAERTPQTPPQNGDRQRP
jgi:hypothetical protein